jgi:bifunctional non-homologous end joining protein LigD
MTTVELDGRHVALTNLDRVLWPAAGFTKGDLVGYYRDVAPVLLPHLAGRPLTLWRFPSGVHREGWWQNECRGAPDWLRTVTLRGQRFCLAEDVASLVWLANLGTVELHPFLTRAGEPEPPLALVFDLDPGPPADVLDCCEVALQVRAELATAGLDSFAKTSGSLGLHVFVPLDGEATFAETKPFARAMAEGLAGERPERVVATPTRTLREGKVLVDWLQNDPTRATVAPYSLRATPWPTVSTPVAWEEVEQALAARKPELLSFTPAATSERIAARGDLFRPVLELRQALPAGTRGRRP